MTQMTPDIAGLLGARICHDLISPLGAVANGLELMAMGGVGDMPEFQLIQDATKAATGKIRLFRIAFGMASAEQQIDGAEVRSILLDAYGGARTQIDWQAAGALPRSEIKLALLLMLCLESAVYAGGRIIVTARNGRWTLQAEASRLYADAGLWDALARAETSADAGPAQVQFILAPPLIRDLGRQIAIDRGDERIVIDV